MHQRSQLPLVDSFIHALPRRGLSPSPVVTRSLKDPYAVLGVSQDDSQEDIKRAYKKLALRYHPDVNKDELAEAKFRSLREAYELLMGKGDPDRQHRAPFGGNWEFHDWYWSFSMQQRKRRQSAPGSSHSASAAQAHKQQVASQLASLKTRARKRGTRSSDDDAFVHSHANGQSKSVSSSPYLDSECDAQDHNAGEVQSESTILRRAQSAPVKKETSTRSPTKATSAKAAAHSTVSIQSPSVLHSMSSSSTLGGSTGFWGHMTAHLSALQRSDIVAEAISRHNICVQNATQHVVECVSGVGSSIGFHIPLHSHSNVGSFKGTDPAASNREPWFERSRVACPVVDTDSGEQGKRSEEKSDEKEDGQDAYQHRRRFTNSPDRICNVQSQLAGLRRKARLHAD